jgi:hypothetical protein
LQRCRCPHRPLVDGPPPEYQRGAAFTCTESYFWPVADTVLSAAFFTTTVLVSSQETFSRQDPGDVLKLWPLNATAVVAGASAAYGYYLVSQCREAKRNAEDYKRWLRPTVRPPPAVEPPPAAPHPAPAAPASPEAGKGEEKI